MAPDLGMTDELSRPGAVLVHTGRNISSIGLLLRSIDLPKGLGTECMREGPMSSLDRVVAMEDDGMDLSDRIEA